MGGLLEGNIAERFTADCACGGGAKRRSFLFGQAFFVTCFEQQSMFQHGWIGKQIRMFDQLGYFGAGEDFFMTFTIAFYEPVMFFQMNFGDGGGHVSGVYCPGRYTPRLYRAPDVPPAQPTDPFAGVDESTEYDATRPGVS